MNTPSTAGTQPADGGNRLPILAAEIRSAHAGALDAQRTQARRAIEAGHALLEAKSLVKHGKWLPWLREYCQISERTAQLYMKLAGLGLESATVADLVAAFGLQSAAQTQVFTSPGYSPFAHCDEAGERDWLLFVLHGVSWPHVEWILNQQFKTPREWLGAEGAAYRSRMGMGEPGPKIRASWATFLDANKDRAFARGKARLRSALGARRMSADRPIAAGTAGKLAKLLPLLGSDKDGEQLAACAAIRRTLGAAGLDLHDLAGAITTTCPPVAHDDGDTPPYSAAWCRETARWCLDHADDDELSDRESRFVHQMARMRFAPTERQAAWLAAIRDHLGGC